MLTQERARELFDYRGGQLIRKVTRSHNAKAGDQAGSFDGHGYIFVHVDGRFYKAHRIIWLMHYGYFPENNIDHINRNPSDNRIENLREIGQACNIRNTGNFKHNTSGVKGVCFDKWTLSWKASVKVRGKSHAIGRSEDLVEAVAMRLAAEQSLNWAGCDNSSPAFKYMQSYLKKSKKP